LKYFNFILFWLVIKPISYLPFFLLYRLSDLLYVFIFYVFKYRKEVVYSNLTKAFPKKNKKEINKIAKDSYRNFCDTVVESLKLFSISKQQLSKRLFFDKLKMVDKYYENKTPIIAITGHFGNWEFTSIMGLRLKHQIIALYKPLKNKYLNNKVKQSRAKFGALLCSNKHTQALLKDNYTRFPMYVFIGDQSPSNLIKAYWSNFLGIETGFFRGSAKAAKKYNYPVITFYVKRIKRGYYELIVKELVGEPNKYTEDEICELTVKAYEEMVLEAPANWLWTHKRWKHKKPKILTNENKQLNATA